MEIIDGRKIADEILQKLKKEVAMLKTKGKKLKLACVLVGKDSASLSFIKRKEISCRDIGIDFQLFKFAQNIREKKLIKEIKKIQEDKFLSGLIIQLPLPKQLLQAEVLETIKPTFDVDCLAPENLGRLAFGRPEILPPAAAAILHILKIYNIKLQGKHIVIVGRGDLVGKPLAILLTQEKCTVTSCNKYTKNLARVTREADILVSCAGVPNLISKKMVKTKASVLDAGVCTSHGKICGDIKFDEIKRKANLISPVPGGIGPVMVAMLLYNVIKLTKKLLRVK
jgi:methylenetetrahydrofolate dehydrogenase (NADP+)/methenyltetrahydrofolate cyclohydrolase